MKLTLNSLVGGLRIICYVWKIYTCKDESKVKINIAIHQTGRGYLDRWQHMDMDMTRKFEIPVRVQVCTLPKTR